MAGLSGRLGFDDNFNAAIIRILLCDFAGGEQYGSPFAFGADGGIANTMLL
jgi:hypothetical protein